MVPQQEHQRRSAAAAHEPRPQAAQRTRAGRWAWVCVLAVVLGGCDAGPDTIQVEVCGNLSVPGELDVLRVSVLDNDRNERASGIVELVKCPGDALTKLPVSLELPGTKGAVWIVVQGLRDCPPPDPQCALGLGNCEPPGAGCTEVIHAERRARTNDNGGASVLTVLDRRCLGVLCPLGQTCEVPAEPQPCDTNDDCPLGTTCFGDDANDDDPQGKCGACVQAPFEVPRSACPGSAAPDSDVMDASYCPNAGGDTQGGDAQP